MLEDERRLDVWGSGGIAKSIINLETRRGWVVRSRPHAVNPEDRTERTPVHTGQEADTARLDDVAER